MTKDWRRTKVYNIRLNQAEDQRFRRVAEARGLDVSQLIRMLVVLADRSPEEPSAPDRADPAWAAAEAAFRRSGIAEALPVHVVNVAQVQVTIAALDTAASSAREGGAEGAVSALVRFRAAVATMPAMHAQPRSKTADADPWNLAGVPRCITRDVCLGVPSSAIDFDRAPIVGTLSIRTVYGT